MNIIIPINMVPDLVEELAIDDSGTRLDLAWSPMIINEFDDHAIEQGILLKERHGGTVIVLAPDVEGVDDALFTASAKGVDQLIKLTGDFEDTSNSHAWARAFEAEIKNLDPGVILAGVQAHDDLDGQVGALLAEFLGYPYVGYVAGVQVEGSKTIVRKEYPGGLVAEMEVTLPAVLGIQAADEPPRYVAFSKVRQAMKEASIDEKAISELDYSGSPSVSRMYKPEVGERAEMIEGGMEDVSKKIISILNDAGVL